MPNGEPGAELEERLSIPSAQLIEDDPSCVVDQRLEEVLHLEPTIGKYTLACQRHQSPRATQLRHRTEHRWK